MKSSIVFPVTTAFFFSSLICWPLHAADPALQSEADRLQNLENAVRQLQERNNELENEVQKLKSKKSPSMPGSRSGLST